MPLLSEILRNIQALNANTPTDPQTILRDSRTAARMWGMRDANLNRIPRSKFLFYVTFNRPNGQGGVTRYGDWTTGVSFLIKSATRPNISFKTETLNQYNKKRVIQTGLEYEPIEITFYDTYDQRVIQMFKEYCQFYYGDFFSDLTGWNYDVTASEFQNVANDLEFGFNAPKTDGNTAYFYSSIEFYQFGGGRFNKFTLVNPKIQSFNYDDEDYSDGNTPQMVRIRFMYEGIIFEADNQPIDQRLAQEYNLDLGYFNDVFFPGFVPNPSINNSLRNTQFSQNIQNASINPVVNPNDPIYVQSRENANPSYTNAIGNGLRLAFSTNPTLAGNTTLNNTSRAFNFAASTIDTLEQASATGIPGRIAENVVRNVGNNLVSRALNRFTGGLFG